MAVVCQSPKPFVHPKFVDPCRLKCLRGLVRMKVRAPAVGVEILFRDACEMHGHGEAYHFWFAAFGEKEKAVLGEESERERERGTKRAGVGEAGG